MTTQLAPDDVAKRIAAGVPGSHPAASQWGVRIRPQDLLAVATFLRDDPAMKFEVLTSQTAVDHIDDEFIEIVYHVLSLKHNHQVVLKVQTDGRDAPMVPSVVDIWRAAEFQEREIYDLFGVLFAGHPDLRRLFMWDEFRGYPLRKDFLPLAQ